MPWSSVWLLLGLIIGSALGQLYEPCGRGEVNCAYYVCSNYRSAGGAANYQATCFTDWSPALYGLTVCKNDYFQNGRLTYIDAKICPPKQCSAGMARKPQPWECVTCGEGSYSAAGEPTYDIYGSAPTPYNCTQCEAGRYQPLAGQTDCLGCVPLVSGNYWAERCGGASAGRQEKCIVCGVGNEVQAACTTTSDTVCRTFMCPAGWYMPRAEENVCFTCAQGMYQPAQGRVSNCTACGPGKYQDLEGQGSCKVCPALVVGSYYQLTPCQGASAGMQARCSTCDVLYKSVRACNATEDTLCRDFQCNPGSYRAAGLSDLCSDCEAGKHQPAAGQTQCAGCAAGKYQPGPRATSCLNCTALAAGSYWAVTCQDARVGRQATCATACLPPFAGIAQNCSTNADMVCGGFACGAGQYQPAAGVMTCAVCEQGKYNPINAATGACQECGAGKYQPMAGASSCLECDVWLPGFYWTSVCQGAIQGAQARCTTACPYGKWKVSACAWNADAVCGPLNYCPGGKVTSLDGCVACPAGTYRPSPADLSVLAPSQCTECEAGTYQPEGAKTGCLLCPLLGRDMYQASPCYGALVGRPGYCSVCQAGKTEVRACTATEDRLCGGACARNATDGTSKHWWITEAQTCAQGEYLWGLGAPPGYAKICRQCPPDMIGLDGVVCARCPDALGMPHWPDQASCVCRPPARMMQGGACACPPGWETGGGGGVCVACGNNSYGAGGGCAACAAGTYSVGPGATACEACEAGRYRLGGEAGRCHGCAGGLGWMATDAATGGCVRCNTSCAMAAGWKEKGPCPGSEMNALLYRECEACEALPANAAWRGGCLYECDAGYYREGARGCARCSEAPCPAGKQWEACVRDADRKCELECANASKPMFNAKWAASTGPGDCPWECEAGYSMARSDYWVFVIYECI